jgi:glycosyltransferase involved in cell wall biosynthesis
VVLGRHAARALPELVGAPGVELREPAAAIVPALAAASVIVVPLRAGAGTRIKILEALALERAVVSTTVGAEGLDVVNGRDLLVADEPEVFAGRVIELLGDPRRRGKLGASGRRLVESRYGWDRAAGILEAFCARVAERSRAAGPGE